jgi:hypothetical protein
MPSSGRRPQSGQVMVLVAVALLALIGSTALVLVAGSVEWQKNQLQELADSAALDSALKVGIGCDFNKAKTVIDEADNFVATRRSGMSALGAPTGSCAASYTRTAVTFNGGLSETVNYPYRAHQQQVEVILTLSLPISFGGEVGNSTTTVVRRAVAQALPASVPTLSATTLTCNGGQVNVAGSVLVQNTIIHNGTCALYAHARFEAASGTYSDLGNVSVYTDGQSWTSTTCGAGLSGSATALCSEGYELSGNTAPACGSATTSFLLAGDKTINPDPCAVGTGPQPVAPLNTALPPEPNLDPKALATLSGSVGTSCVAAAVYPNIVVGGTTVATGLAPAPVKDATGFYHFKPSCYGYLNVGAFNSGPGIANRQIGVKSPVATGSVTPTLPLASLAGTLLVATIRSDTNPSDKPFTASAGWLPAIAGGAFEDDAAHTEIWYYPNNPGGIMTASFGVSPGSINAIAQMTEWTGVDTVSPLDQTGILAVPPNQTSVTISTSGATAVGNELVVTDVGLQVKAAQAYTPGAGWTNLVSDQPNGFASEYRLNLPGGAVAGETISVTKTTAWALVIATFKPAGGGGGPASAVLDPGFYYFNGSGFAGGGGICLGGATLLARDVTLEFVNAAGFSSNSCVAGGGGDCTSPCKLGSDPTSPVTDPPGNPLSWFAAPCNAVPNPPNASCPGSAWCTLGDRSCTNQLIWAPPTATGQISVTGPNSMSWLLGTINWPSTDTCTIQTNGTSTIAGVLACGSLSITAGAGGTTTVGSDYGINTAVAEAVLIE